MRGVVSYGMAPFFIRICISKRLASVDKRDGKLKGGYDDWFLFRSVSGFMRSPATTANFVSIEIEFACLRLKFKFPNTL